MIKSIKYQDDAITEMLRRVDKCLEEDEKEFLFQAPTGSGKTITMGRFFESYFKKHEGERVAFIWLSPGKGDLAGQSKRSMEKNFKFPSLSLSDMLLNREIRSGDVIFINWEAVNKKGNVAMRKGEKANVQDIVDMSYLDKLIVVVDESHEARNATKALEVLDVFNADIVIDVTATPRKDAAYKEKHNVVKIPISSVIEEGFIKKQVVLNEDLPSLSVQDVLKTAVKKRDEIEEAYRKYEKYPRTPLILVQIENDRAVDVNGSKRPRAEVIKEQLIMAGLHNDEIAIWVSDKKMCQNLEGIKVSDVKALIFKSAIATGYDIDRAHILVKLRDAKSEIFNAQVLGRILRTQNKKFYDDELVDSAYVYTEFSTYEYKLDMDDDLKERLVQPRKEAVLKAEVKEGLPKFKLPMVKKLLAKDHSIDSNLLHKRIDKELTLEFLASLPFDPSSVTETVRSGKLESAKMLEEEYFTGLGETVTRMTDIDALNTANKYMRSLSRHVNPGSITLGVLKKDGRMTEMFDVVWFYLQNRELIDAKITNALDAYFELRFKKAVVDEVYSPPESVFYRGVQEVTNEKYAYTLEPELSKKATRSSSEQTFADFLNASDNVLYWYKNENHSEHFSVSYQQDDYSAGLYYPDFIIITRDMKLYIVDVKAPIKNNTSSDIKNVQAKYNSGKQYEASRMEDVMNAGFSSLEFSMIKLRSGKPFICKAQEYSEKFDDEMIWAPFEV